MSEMSTVCSFRPLRDDELLPVPRHRTVGLFAENGGARPLEDAVEGGDAGRSKRSHKKKKKESKDKKVA